MANKTFALTGNEWIQELRHEFRGDRKHARGVDQFVKEFSAARAGASPRPEWIPLDAGSDAYSLGRSAYISLRMLEIDEPNSAEKALALSYANSRTQADAEQDLITLAVPDVPFDGPIPSSEYLASIGFGPPYYGRPAPRGFGGLLASVFRVGGRGLDAFATGWAWAYDHTSAGVREMVLGGLVCGAGIVVTVVTYTVASGGGQYVIAWGAILFGGILFLRGLVKSFR